MRKRLDAVMTAPNQIPYLSEECLSGLSLTYSDIAAEIERIIRGRRRGDVWSAPKSSVALPDGRYAMTTMALGGEPPYLATKSLLLNPANPGRGQPLMNSVVILHDGETGVPLALMDGNWLTARRTAALSLVAAKRMAPSQATVIAFIGCGVQARSHLQAFAEQFPLKTALAFGRGQANIEALGRTAGALGLTYRITHSIKDALAEADIVISAVTRSPDLAPFVDAAALKPGAFAALTDLGHPWKSDSLEAIDRLIIDDVAQEAAQKDKLAPIDLVAGDIDMLLHDAIPGRTAAGERTAFIYRGYALADFALACLAYARSNGQTE